MEKEHNSAVQKVEKIMEKNHPQKKFLEKTQAQTEQKEKERISYAREKLIGQEEKQRLKQEKAERKFLIKQEKIRQKKEKRNNKEFNKNEKRKRKNGNTSGGLIATIVSLAVICLALTGTLTYFLITPSKDRGMLEGTYQKSYYETVEQVDNIDLNLSKILATSDGVAMQKYLVDTAINSELCEAQLQQLPIEDENKFYTTKLINQIGDYSKYLNNKLAKGEGITEQDVSCLVALYQANKNLKNTLDRISSKMQEGFSFSNMSKEFDDNYFLEGFNELENLSIEYPELIYDGPFSDGMDRLEIKGLPQTKVTNAEAREIFAQTFKDYGIEAIESVGITDGDIKSFNVQGTIKNEVVYAQISEQGGKIIMFAYAGSCLAMNFSRENAIEKAQNFLQKQGVKNMKEVWINLADNVYTINFAFEENGVIVYPDLIKVRVCAETAMVIGLEATSYYTNHTIRAIEEPKISKAQAMEKVSDNIEITSSRLVVVPIGQKSEKLCYEFCGEYDGSTYYVYIDAITARQVEMFKVVKSGEGELLM